MSAYPPPTKTSSIFNPTFFISSDSSTVTTDYLSTYYLKKAGGQTVLAEETFSGGIKTDSLAPTTTNDLGITLTSTASSGTLITPLALFASNISGTKKAQLMLGQSNASGKGMYIQYNYNNDGTNTNAHTNFGTLGYNPTLTLRNGRVGIGNTTNPSVALDVTGDAKVSGSLTLSSSLTLSNPITPYTSTGITPTSTQLGYQGAANLASNLTLTSATDVTVVSWNITPGVWLLEGHATVRFSTGSTNAVTAFNHYISTDSSNSYMTKYEGPPTFSTSTSSKTVTYIIVVTNSSLSSMSCSWIMNATWTGTSFYAVGNETRATAVRYTRIA